MKIKYLIEDLCFVNIGINNVTMVSIVTAHMKGLVWQTVVIYPCNPTVS